MGLFVPLSPDAVLSILSLVLGGAALAATHSMAEGEQDKHLWMCQRA